MMTLVVLVFTTRCHKGDPSVLGMSSFLNRLYWFGVVGVHLGSISWRGPLWGPSVLCMSSFLNQLYWCGVVGLCTLGVN